MWPNPQFWPHLLKKSLMEKFIICAVYIVCTTQFQILKFQKNFFYVANRWLVLKGVENEGDVGIFKTV